MDPTQGAVAKPKEPSDSSAQSPEELSEWQVCSAYVEGRKVQKKPKMAEKMVTEGVHFNIFVLFLGPIYYLYRKQYTIGWAYFAFLTIGNLIVVYLLPTVDGLWTAFLFIFELGMAFAFYPIYRQSAKRAYEAWKSDPAPTQNALGYIEQCGGTNWAPVIVCIAINLALNVVDFMLNPLSLDEYDASTASIVEVQPEWAEEGVFYDPHTGKRFVVDGD